mgnify:CR=1 FL=1
MFLLNKSELACLAHFFVASLVCSRTVLFIQLGRKPSSRLELHPNTQVLNKKLFAGMCFGKHYGVRLARV